MWSELLAFGSTIRDEPHHVDAMAVARETMLRAKRNVDTLIDRLTMSGGEGYSIRLPNAAIDAHLEFEWHKTTFVDYICICFRWAGFRGLERAEEGTKFLEVLKLGLLPL